MRCGGRNGAGATAKACRDGTQGEARSVVGVSYKVLMMFSPLLALATAVRHAHTTQWSSGSCKRRLRSKAKLVELTLHSLLRQQTAIPSGEFVFKFFKFF